MSVRSAASSPEGRLFGTIIALTMMVASGVILVARSRGMHPPAVTGRDGRDVRLETTRPMLLHFWATWCVPCGEELPRLVAYAHARRLPLVTIAQNQSFAEVDAFLKQHAIAPDVVVYLDPKLHASRAFRVSTLPATLTFDANGNVVDRIERPGNW
jgi:thiol-disulfide isomerase/thioredoxin